MTEAQAKQRANILNKFVHHPELSYRCVKVGDFKYAVAQFFGEKEVAIVS